MDFGEAGPYVLLDFLGQFFQAFIALDYVPSRCREFECLRTDLDLTDNAVSEPVGQLFVMFQSPVVGFAHGFLPRPQNNPGFFPGDGFLRYSPDRLRLRAVRHVIFLLECHPLHVMAKNFFPIDVNFEISLAPVIIGKLLADLVGLGKVEPGIELTDGDDGPVKFRVTILNENRKFYLLNVLAGGKKRRGCKIQLGSLWFQAACEDVRVCLDKHTYYYVAAPTPIYGPGCAVAGHGGITSEYIILQSCLWR